MRKFMFVLSFIGLFSLLNTDLCMAKKAPTPKATPMKYYMGKATFYRAYTKKARTKSGTIPRNGKTLSVDPKVIPLGSTVEIIYPNGLKEVRIAEDTGKKIKGFHVDVFYNAPRKHLLQLGVQKIQIRILAYPKSA